jgi:hypothetical protein
MVRGRSRTAELTYLATSAGVLCVFGESQHGELLLFVCVCVYGQALTVVQVFVFEVPPLVFVCWCMCQRRPALL